MKTGSLIILLVGVITITGCQPAAPTPPEINVSQTETQAAYALQTGLTLTAAAEKSANETLTAAAPTPTSTPQPTPTIHRVHINIPASACWVNTGVKISTGEALVMGASGQANTWGGRDISNGGPGGQPKNMCGDVKCPLLGANYGALIGRIGEGETFLVGSRLELTAEEAGELYLTINDWECADNSGSFTVTITFK